MSPVHFSLVQHPWLFTLVFILIFLVCTILVRLLLIMILKFPQNGSKTDFWAPLIQHLLTLFVIVPFGLGFLKRSDPYTAYLDEIHLTPFRPLLGLILLGISCYLILALCQAVGVLVYRLREGQPVDKNFIRSAFVLANELPPRSSSWWTTFPSIFEEVAFRGVILAMFLRFYDQPKAILFSALGFGLMHIFNLLNRRELVWVGGQIVWAVILGLFYGYVTLKTDSLLPAMIVHYLGNLFISALNAYIQQNAPIRIQALYGIIFTLGAIPSVLMSLWVYAFTSLLLS